MDRRPERVARRAVDRWSWRLFRREWRSQLLVLGLLTFAVAAGVFASTAAYNAPRPLSGHFGTASHRIEVSIANGHGIGPLVAEARRDFGSVDVVRSQVVRVPGSTSTIELRDQPLDGHFTRPLAHLTAGRAPHRANEVALTDGVASLLDARVGQTVTVGGARLHVVGAIEDPNDLADEFALVAPGGVAHPEQVSMFVRADDQQVMRFHPGTGPENLFIESRGKAEKSNAALGVLVIMSVAMLLVSLVAGAAFMTLAHRRLRQLGMLTAIGATPRLLRRAVVANGAVVGGCAALAGIAVGLVAWLLTAPSLEQPFGHRVDRFEIPLWVPLGAGLLAVVSAIAAAWFPARSVARSSVTDAISARPPRPVPARHSLVLALVFLAAGIAGVALGIDPNRDDQRVYLFLPGLVCTVIATLLLAAPCLRALARGSGRWPVASRLALRELARYGSRSSAALGAISLGLGIAVAVVVIAAAAVPSAAQGNLGSHELVLWTSDIGSGQPLTPELTPNERQRADDVVAGVRRMVADATVVPLDVVIDPSDSQTIGGRKMRDVVKVARRINAHSFRDGGLVFVARPALLEHLGIDPSTVDPSTYLLTSQHSPPFLIGGPSAPFDRGPARAGHVRHVALPAYSSAPHNLMTSAGLEAFGLSTERTGWLVESPHALSSATLAKVRSAAANAGLVVETRDEHGSLTDIRTGASVVGVLVALCILAMTIGLLRSEVAHEVRTLTAVGGTSFTRRALTASTAAALALVGVVLGGGAAYAALVAGYWPNTDELHPVPVSNLVAIGIGFPLLATAISWVVGGRAPAHVGRVAE
jgi:putative ABC transport system permease protein